jgi:hypothetical protein
MAKTIKAHQRFINGISDYLKEDLLPDSYYMGRAIDDNSDPKSIKLNPKAIKESGSIIDDLLKWGDTVENNSYFYGSNGGFYKRTNNGSWSKLRTVANSHGNGLSYFGEDDFIYYTSDKVIGRYGPLSQAPSFTDDFLGSQGGVPLNTNSLSLVAASSQYAYRADTASLSVTGNLSIEAMIKPSTVPSGVQTQTLVAKWNGSGNLRSYKFEVATQSNYFGNGQDGALTISSNTTDNPIDSACTGTAGTYTLSATNPLFAAGQQILIHQTQGAGAGTWMKNQIQSYSSGVITTVYPLNATYTTGAQVLVLKQYTNVTVNSGVTWTAKAWNGTTGGILAFLANGTVTVNGTITASEKGFRGGSSPTEGVPYALGKRGESYGSSTYNDNSTSPNYGGGGGGWITNGSGSGGGAGGGGAYGGVGGTYTEGAYTTSGGNGCPGGTTAYGGLSGNTYGSQDLKASLYLGSGGGSGANSYSPGHGGYGGRGGGIVFIASANIQVNGSISSNGQRGEVANLGHACGGGGGGSGGAILLQMQTGSLGTSKVTAYGGLYGYNTNGFQIPGGAGGVGRIHVNYLTSYTGSTDPAMYVTQDNSLGDSNSNTLRLTISNNGSNTEVYQKPASIQTGVWQSVAVTWQASTSTATFYLNGVNLGSQTGSFTSISDNTSEFFIGCYKDDSGNPAGFYNGLIDEVRVFNRVRSQSEIQLGMIDQIITSTSGLQAYYKFNSTLTDSTANSNNLTNAGTTYSTDVPFPAPTTRADIDQQATTTGSTYTVPTSISEASTGRKTFTPKKDPQKSIAVNIASKGTGNWTLTVHDQYNNVIASKTIANSLLTTGFNEFIFDNVWRPLINAQYHFHLTSTVADGTVTTTNAGDLETVSYRTYYQFLVEDTQFHPIAKMLQFLVIGNERYVATYEATLYDPNKITLPAGYRVRCFGYWNEYLAIGTVRGDNIYDYDSGRVYFWDGIAPTYNFFIDIPEGGVNALFGSKGRLYIFAGYQGDILEYSGGAMANKIKRIPLIEPTKYVEIYPGAVNMWRTMLRFGVTGNSDSTEIQRGVYSWGSLNVKYSDSLSFDYPISTGQYGDTVKIGLVYPVNRKLIIGWQDGAAFGADYVDTANPCYNEGTIEFMLEDDDAIWKEKEAISLVANFNPLKNGQSIDLKYKIDREDNWHNLGKVSKEGETKARLQISKGGSRYKEIQYAVDLYSETGESPVLLGVTLEKDLLEKETRVG